MWKILCYLSMENKEWEMFTPKDRWQEKNEEF